MPVMSSNPLDPLASTTFIPVATATTTRSFSPPIVTNLAPTTAANVHSPSTSFIDLSFAFFTVAFESVLYGIFIVLTLTALYLWFHRSHPSIASQHSCSFERESIKTRLWRTLICLKNPLVFGSIILSLLILGHWMCTVARVIEAAEMIKMRRNPLPFYETLSDPNFVLMSVFLTLAVPVADLLLIWRLWIISQRSLWVIIAPTLIVAVFCACGLRTSAWLASSSPGSSIFDADINGWILSNIVLTACSNIYCTTFLVYYISRIGSEAKAYSRINCKPILATIIDSAAIHSLWSIVVIVAYQTRSKFALPALDAGPAVAGIAFMLINVRVGLGWDMRPRSSISELLEVDTLPTYVDTRGGVGQELRSGAGTPTTGGMIQSDAMSTSDYESSVGCRVEEREGGSGQEVRLDTSQLKREMTALRRASLLARVERPLPAPPFSLGLANRSEEA